MTHDDTTAPADRATATALADSWLALWNGDLDLADAIISETNLVHAARPDDAAAGRLRLTS